MFQLFLFGNLAAVGLEEVRALCAKMYCGSPGLRPLAGAMHGKALPDGMAMAFGQGLWCGAKKGNGYIKMRNGCGGEQII